MRNVPTSPTSHHRLFQRLVHQIPRMPWWRLFLIALISRCILVAYLLMCAVIGSPYDASERYYPELMAGSACSSTQAYCGALAARSPCTSSAASEESSTSVVSSLEHSFRSLNHWDGVHYWSIASCGYQFAPQRAFFPLFPIGILGSIRRLASWWLVLNNNCGSCSEACSSQHDVALFSLLCYAAVCVFNMFCFSCAAVTLRYLTKQMLRNPVARRVFGFPSSDMPNQIREDFIRRVLLIFFLSPASLFTVVTYTESLFTVLSMVAAVLFNDGHWWLGAVIAATAASARSNGLLLVIPLFFDAAVKLQALFAAIRSSSWHLQVYLHLITSLLSRALQCLVIAAPYGIVNYWSCMATHQHSFHDGSTPSFRHRDDDGDACGGLGFLGFYADVQERYWNVGWLRYYTLRKSPNFLIAFPLPFFVIVGIVLARRRRTSQAEEAQLEKTKSRFEDRFFFYLSNPWSLMLVISIGLCSVMLHVETINRLLLPNPALYWWTAPILMRKSQANFSQISTAFVVFLVSWTVIGGALFANHLPWT